MSEQNTIDPKNIVREVTDPKRGILEELNLPPKVIKFLRENAKNIQIALACLVVVILASSFYDHYKDQQRDKSAALLANALQQDSDEQKKTALESLINDYSGTGAALMARIELAHIAFEGGNYMEAVAEYEEAFDKTSSRNPMAPLLQYSLAQAYENGQDLDNALKHYRLLTKNAGFAIEGYMAIGRIYQAKGQVAEAKEAYQQVLEQEGVTQTIKGTVEEKLAKLGAK